MNIKVARFDCPKNSLGRYVHLSLSGNQYLHLCEVEVFGGKLLFLILKNLYYMNTQRFSSYLEKLPEKTRFLYMK